MNERYLTLSLGREPTTERAVVARTLAHDLVARALRRELSVSRAPRAARRDQSRSARAPSAIPTSRPIVSVSVLEVAAVGEDHADPRRVGGLDDLEVALGAAGLDDRRRRPRRPRAAGRRRTGRTRRRRAPRPAGRRPPRAPSRSRAARSRRGSSAPRRCPTDARSRASTIALERTCLQTFQPNSISPHSASVGLRSVTTSISERSSRSMSRSWTSRPPMTRLRSRSAMLKRRRSLSSRMRMFGLDSSSSSASSV